LWDRVTGRIVTNDHAGLDVDLATEMRDLSTTGVELYPPDLRAEIDGLNRWIGPVVNQGVHRAAGTGPEAARARIRINDAFDRLDRRLASSRYLLGNRLTLADTRLWVTLVRYDVPEGGRRRIGSRLARFPRLWAYAQGLYEHDAFRTTTEPARFPTRGIGQPVLPSSSSFHEYGWPLGLPTNRR
jgi:putative glutathione S-transferase